VTPFPYRVVVRWSEEDEAYIAEVPAVFGAGGDGPSLEEAVRAAQESVREILEVSKEHGDPIPPSDVEAPKYSGQIRLRMPMSLHRELAEEAERERVSLNQWMVTLLARRGPGVKVFQVSQDPRVMLEAVLSSGTWASLQGAAWLQRVATSTVYAPLASWMEGIQERPATTVTRASKEDPQWLKG
jgi:predicted HicB family RNase H-like nuclease